MLSYLEILLRRLCMEIAVDLGSYHREMFKFLCDGHAGGDSGSVDVFAVLRMMSVFVDQDWESLCLKMAKLKCVLKAIGRDDLVEDKVGLFEFQGELLCVFSNYRVLVSGDSEWSLSDGRRTTAVKILKNIVNENNDMDKLMSKVYASGEVHIRGMCLEFDNVRSDNGMCWNTVAVMLAFTAEVLAHATEAQREGCLMKIVDELSGDFFRWMSKNGNWDEFYSWIEGHSRERLIRDAVRRFAMNTRFIKH